MWPTTEEAVKNYHLYTAEALRRREKAFCFQISAPPRLCGEKDLRGLFHSFGSRGEYGGSGNTC